MTSFPSQCGEHVVVSELPANTSAHLENHRYHGHDDDREDDESKVLLNERKPTCRKVGAVSKTVPQEAHL